MITHTAKPTTEDRIIEVISWTLNVPAAHIHPDTHLRDDLYLDPVDMLLLIAKLENSFNVYLSPDEVESIETVRDVSLLIRRHAA